ncbi:MAG: deoxyribodipyrimidine photo-lyase [Solirubrobacteraceae bacterium]
MSTAIVWLRRDLRVRDHPALRAAGERVVPLFVVDPALVARAPAPRATFLAGCLAALDGELRERGGRLVVRHGRPERVLPDLAREVGAAVAHWTADASPVGRSRDGRVAAALEDAGIAWRAHPGQYVVDPDALRTGAGGPYRTFTPFGRSWAGAPRRTIVDAPSSLVVPRVAGDGLPTAGDLTGPAPWSGPVARDWSRPLPTPVVEPGEEAGLRAARAWLDGPLERYADERDRLDDGRAVDHAAHRAFGGSSGLSAHLRFGTVSAAWLERRADRMGGEGAAAFVRQLAWRDFFAHVYRAFPDDRGREHQERYRALRWEDDDEALEAWCAGRTGYPLVDAGMRQLAATGWMPNRVRMVVGSFLTKDLHLDWRLGERWFWSRLLDADPPQNDGNWQWIASVGVDPKPYFQRLFNPVLQQRRFDPHGHYVRRWVPELADVPDASLAEPWRMTDAEQAVAHCRIGPDYPAPIVDHAEEREHAAMRYREAAAWER